MTYLDKYLLYYPPQRYYGKIYAESSQYYINKEIEALNILCDLKLLVIKFIEKGYSIEQIFKLNPNIKPIYNI